jgi:hypothetical protein
MIEPSLAFQTALRAALIGSADLVALVPAANIRAGSVRATDLPSITFAGFHTQFLGRAAGSQLLARVGLDLNIWAEESGADVARAIGMKVLSILIDAPEVEGFSIDEYAKPQVIWLRDAQPDKNYTHGVVTLEAVLRWRV